MNPDLFSQQEIFNICYQHMMNLSAPVGEEAGGRYRQGSLKCPAGLFISDDLYHLGMESQPWHKLAHTLGYTKHTDLISQIQYIHDTFPKNKWEKLLEKVARKFDLSLPN